MTELLISYDYEILCWALRVITIGSSSTLTLISLTMVAFLTQCKLFGLPAMALYFAPPSYCESDKWWPDSRFGLRWLVVDNDVDVVDDDDDDDNDDDIGANTHWSDRLMEWCPWTTAMGVHEVSRGNDASLKCPARLSLIGRITSKPLIQR